MKPESIPVKCKKHQNYKKKPTWSCETCKKEKEFWEKLQK